MPPLPCIVNNAGRRCKARAKSTQQQCWAPAAFGTTVCRVHGAVRPEARIKGKQHHFYKHGCETVAERKARPALNKKLKAFEYALKTGDYSKLPETPELKKLRKEQAKVYKNST